MDRFFQLGAHRLTYMTRRTVALLALTVMIGLSGCSGLFGGQGTPTPSQPVHDAPLDGQRVLEMHDSALTAAGSFRYQRNETARLHTERSLMTSHNQTVQANLTADTLRSRADVSLQPERDTYATGGTVYQRQATAAGVEYVRSEVNATTYTRAAIDGYFAGLEFSKAGTSTVDGVTVDRYTVTKPSQIEPSAHNTALVSADNITSISATVDIDRQGVIRAFDYRVTGRNAVGDRVTHSLSVRYTDVGSTTVPEPDWLPDARNATDR